MGGTGGNGGLAPTPYAPAPLALLPIAAAPAALIGEPSEMLPSPPDPPPNGDAVLAAPPMPLAAPPPPKLLLPPPLPYAGFEKNEPPPTWAGREVEVEVEADAGAGAGAGADAGAPNAAPRSKSELLPDGAAAGAPPSDRLARSSSGLVVAGGEAVPPTARPGVPGAGAEKASSSSKSMSETCLACERALAPGWPEASLLRARGAGEGVTKRVSKSTSSRRESRKVQEEGRDARRVDVGRRRAVAGLEGVVALEDLVDEVVDEEEAVCESRVLSVSHTVVDETEGERGRARHTHRVGVVLCRVGDPLLQLGLDVPALLRDLLRAK